jgi:hypothetical protein
MARWSRWRRFKHRMKGWNTIAFNALSGLLLITPDTLQALELLPLDEFEKARWRMVIGLFAIVGNVLIRIYVTTGPVGSKEGGR